MKSIKRIGRKLVKNVQAVSPIIATLMLVLVAVGSAGAFYMWQSGWQSDVEGKAGGADIKSSLSIGGSSTVYEFTAIAKQIFEAANPNYKIELQKGGSGAGIAAAGMGLVDIGAASKDASGDFTKYPDLNRDGVKDIGVEMVQTTVGYDGVVVVVGKAFAGTLTSIDKTTLAGIFSGTITDWNNVPQTWNGNTTTPGPVFNVSTTIRTADRSDESGTEECFSQKLCGFTPSQLTITCDISKGSNQELIQALSTDTTAIGFTAFGIADLNPDKVTIIPYAKDGSLATGDGKPTKAEIKSGAWPGSRPLNFLTVGKPTGAAKVFIDFCLTPEANLNICGLSDYVSIY